MNKDDNKKEDSPGDRVIQEIHITITTSRRKWEVDLLKAILLKAGITSVLSSSKKDRQLVYREKKNERT